MTERNEELSRMLIEAIERDLADQPFGCFLQRRTDPEFGDEEAILRILNVPDEELVAVEDRAYEVARNIAAGRQLPFAISTHLPTDSAPGGAFFAQAFTQSFTKRFSESSYIQATTFTLTMEAPYVQATELSYIQAMELNATFHMTCEAPLPVFVEALPRDEGDRPDPRRCALHALAA